MIYKGEARPRHSPPSDSPSPSRHAARHDFARPAHSGTVDTNRITGGIMGNSRRSLAIAIIVTGTALALAACGGTTPSTTTSAAATATTSAASSSHTASRQASPPTRTPAATHSAPKTSTTAKVADVDCGPITAANGQKLRVVAKGSAAGVAGCSEAIDVLTAYFQRGSEGQGTAHELTVQGWQCSTIDNGVTKEVLTGCEKDGLSIAAVNG